MDENVKKVPVNSEKMETEEKEHYLPPTYEVDEKWVQEHMGQFGIEPSFF